MTPHYARKLHSTLVDIKRQVEKTEPVAEIPQLEELFKEFTQAVADDDMSRQSKAVKKLIEELVRWRVGRM